MYRQIFAKIGTHGKIAPFPPLSFDKIGTVPIKWGQLAGMQVSTNSK